MACLPWPAQPAPACGSGKRTGGAPTAAAQGSQALRQGGGGSSSSSSCSSSIEFGFDALRPLAPWLNPSVPLARAAVACDCACFQPLNRSDAGGTAANLQPPAPAERQPPAPGPGPTTNSCCGRQPPAASQAQVDQVPCTALRLLSHGPPRTGAGLSLLSLRLGVGQRHARCLGF